MADEGFSDRWDSAVPSEEVRKALVGSIEARQHGVILSATAAQITADFGSHVAFRLKGALLARPDEFPIHAVIAMTPGATGTAVKIQLSEAMGLGVKTGTGRKYLKAYEDLAGYLRQGLVPA